MSSEFAPNDNHYSHHKDDDVAKGNGNRWKEPCFKGPLSSSDLIKEAKVANPRTMYFDLKFNRSREIMIYMEETKIWQDLLEDCADRSGVNSIKACQQLREIMTERIAYYNSNFNAALRPKQSPGLPAIYENVVQKEEAFN